MPRPGGSPPTPLEDAPAAATIPSTCSSAAAPAGIDRPVRSRRSIRSGSAAHPTRRRRCDGRSGRACTTGTSGSSHSPPRRRFEEGGRRRWRPARGCVRRHLAKAIRRRRRSARAIHTNAAAIPIDHAARTTAATMGETAASSGEAAKDGTGHLLRRAVGTEERTRPVRCGFARQFCAATAISGRAAGGIARRSPVSRRIPQAGARARSPTARGPGRCPRHARGRGR